MKCQKCGAEMVPGHLYCDICGAEYQIVPDFEPEIENSIAESLSGIQKEIKNNASEKAETKNIEKKEAAGKPVKPSFGLIFFFVLVFAAGMLFGMIKYTGSAAYLEQKARSAIRSEDYHQAAQLYERVRKKDPGNADWYLKEAECRLALEDKDSAYRLALLAIQAEENTASAYDFLLSYLQTEENYIEMKQILADCGEETILHKYWEFSGQTPAINYESGFYDHSLLLSFAEGYEGTVYYTLDEQIAYDASLIYEKPIPLGNGSHILSVVYENKYGITSDPAVYQYEIESEIPLAPLVSLENGTYEEAQFLTVEVEEGTRVFYTTDATIPTMESREYTGPIALPLGKTILNLVAYNGKGVAGEITQCQFVLNMKINLSQEEAKGILIQKLIASGHILDQNGALEDRYGVFGYFYKYPVSDSGSNYYIFEEHYLENQINNPLGNFYAVDVISGDVYQWVLDTAGEYRKIHF